MARDSFQKCVLCSCANLPCGPSIRNGLKCGAHAESTINETKVGKSINLTKQGTTECCSTTLCDLPKYQTSNEHFGDFSRCSMSVFNTPRGRKSFRQVPPKNFQRPFRWPALQVVPGIVAHWRLPCQAILTKYRWHSAMSGTLIAVLSVFSLGSSGNAAA